MDTPVESILQVGMHMTLLSSIDDFSLDVHHDTRRLQWHLGGIAKHQTHLDRLALYVLLIPSMRFRKNPLVSLHRSTCYSAFESSYRNDGWHLCEGIKLTDIRYSDNVALKIAEIKNEWMRQWARTVLIVERSIPPAERLQHQNRWCTPTNFHCQ